MSHLLGLFDQCVLIGFPNRINQNRDYNSIDNWKPYNCNKLSMYILLSTQGRYSKVHYLICTRDSEIRALRGKVLFFPNCSVTTISVINGISLQ